MMQAFALKNVSEEINYSQRYSDKVLVRCGRSLTDAEFLVFHGYMTGKVPHDDPRLKADREGDYRISSAIKEAISWGLG